MPEKKPTVKSKPVERVSKADLSKLKSELRAEFNSKLEQLRRATNVTFED